MGKSQQIYEKVYFTDIQRNKLKQYWDDFHLSGWQRLF